MASPQSSRVLCRYAVAFKSDGKIAGGSLEITDWGVVLTAGRDGESVAVRIPREDLTAVRIGRTSAERMNGYSTVVLERRSGPAVFVAPFGFALLHEIADLLNSLNARPAAESERLELIVPLKKGSSQDVRRLIAVGPPFDLRAAGFRRHDVYLEESQIRFVFEGHDVRNTLKAMLGDASVWRAGLAWSRHIAAPPYVNDDLDGHTPAGVLIYGWRC